MGVTCARNLPRNPCVGTYGRVAMFNLNYLGVRPGPLPEALRVVPGDGNPVFDTLDALDPVEMVFEILFFFLDVL